MGVQHGTNPETMLRSVCATARLLPQRALKAKKGKKQQRSKQVVGEVRLVPHIPNELIKETKEFFSNQPKVKALLELVFSPRDPQDSEGDRLDYEEAKVEFDAMAAR